MPAFCWSSSEPAKEGSARRAAVRDGRWTRSNAVRATLRFPTGASVGAPSPFEPWFSLSQPGLESSFNFRPFGIDDTEVDSVSDPAGIGENVSAQCPFLLG